jgi:lysozyme
MTLTVIDVSHYQAGLKLATFKAQGGLAVIAKASQGISSADANFASFRIDAAANGLAFASYHYLTIDDPTQQAAWYLTCAAPGPGERVIADWEASGVTAPLVVAFLRAIQKERPDLELTVYSGAAAKAGVDAASASFLNINTSLWLAQYTTGTPSWPSGVWRNWSLWQYTDAAAIDGWSGDLDASRFNGSNANLLKWFGPAAAQPPAPAPAPSIPTVIVDISTDQPITLIVNGNVLAINPATSN